MSLLIKALDKAQAEKAKKADATKDADANVKQEPAKRHAKASSGATTDTKTKATEQTNEEALSLSPPEENLTQTSAGQPKTNTINDEAELPAAVQGSAAEAKQRPTAVKNQQPRVATQSQAANVFAAKQVTHSNSIAKVALIIGVVALVLLAAIAYWYQTVLNQPDIVVPPRPAAFEQVQVTPTPLPDAKVEPAVSAEMESEATGQAETVVESEANEMVAETLEAQAVNQPSSVSESTIAPEPATKVFESVEAETSVEQTLAKNETVVEPAMIAIDRADTDNAAIEIVKKRTVSEVDPILMRAYEAYVAGNDQQALTDYKQVLRQFGPNVDAMLGLGAIAARQGRLADAKDWYQKVLEIAPRNETAKAGLLNLQQESQPQANESSIKSMLAVTPEDANLHAALGNIYAERGQWASAQQAYFDAYRFHSSAEHAFNLAVSLDQLGKPKLALPYYQEALQKADQSSVIDTAALQARISAIENQ